MISFRDTLQAITLHQAGAQHGMVAVADINHRDFPRGDRKSPLCLGKRRRLSMRSYSCPPMPVPPAAGGGMSTITTSRPLWSGVSGGPAAALWAALVIERALSS
jgi:hypothetical protein